MATKTYTVQVNQTVCIEREVKAETMEDALEKARELAGCELLKPRYPRSWSVEWTDLPGDVAAVMS